MSAGLNTLAGIIYEDFVTLCLPKQVSDQTSSIIMKIIVIVLGCLSVLLVYVVEKLGPVMQVEITNSSDKFIFKMNDFKSENYTSRWH